MPRIDVNVRLSFGLHKYSFGPCFMTSLPAGGVWPGAERGRHARLLSEGGFWAM